MGRRWNGQQRCGRRSRTPYELASFPSQRFEECHEFAHAIGAWEIIFLPSYLAIINLSFYDKGWVAFWRAYLAASGAETTISMGNTFEYHPDLMVRVVEKVNRPNFRMAFDLGHFLVYGKEPLGEWSTGAWMRTRSRGRECSRAGE